MKVRCLQNGSMFLEAVENLMIREEAANSLILGLARALQTAPQRYGVDPFFAIVSSETGIELAALHTPPHHLVLAAPGSNPGAAAGHLAVYLINAGIAITGFNGRAEVVEPFARAWQRRGGPPPAIRFRQLIYRLDRVTPPRTVAGHIRRGVTTDMPLIEQWLDQFNLDALGHSSPQSAHQQAELRIRAGEIYLWEDDVAVAMAATARPTANTVTINMVYTPPPFRNRGYAGACVARLSEMMLNEGYTSCVLFTDLANPTSNSIYRKIGYQPVCDYFDYNLMFDDT